jgi:hypothetical protein
MNMQHGEMTRELASSIRLATQLRTHHLCCQAFSRPYNIMTFVILIIAVETLCEKRISLRKKQRKKRKLNVCQSKSTKGQDSRKVAVK